MSIYFFVFISVQYKHLKLKNQVIALYLRIKLQLDS